jgi:uroporphyrin-III C-methyltransferase/precorrin-2 dehydrogenase/sirohydrochlorin ferrochelatase/uroporphyrin-III C-methyltransferase
VATQLRTVYLVGAGPGDPDLLTVKALRLIENAEVVVYDRLVGKGIVDRIPTGTMRIFVGKETGRHHIPQDEINELLVNLARAGRGVVRLKGGDPYIFGRGGEEALHLARNGIPFEVVPGLSSASGCSASVGIPLTHRGLATSVRLVTGHARDDKELELDWKSLGDPDCTLVIYMGLGKAEEICRNLIANGLSPDTQVAAIENGTLLDERINVTTLGKLPASMASLDFKPPTILIIGRVVELASILGREARETLISRHSEAHGHG